jgi:tetratricopeptide (TPR) repeat protein
MYEHFRPSDDVFVDREEYLNWMDEALVRCKKKSVVLHLKGIGGIGKSSLLKHWIRTKEKTIRVDCEQHSAFYARLNVIAKGVVLHGVNLQRFDVLWQIRQRFVEGVEPVREEGREWAKDVVMAIPFIGSLASIGSAITAVGSKVTPKLKGKYGTVGKWLQDRLGKNHIECLLEILWKEPRHAEFLYLDALLEDINKRKDDSPILFLFDHFEYVDSETSNWRYQDKKINEVELWSIFLCSLENCVSVMAGRKPPVKRKDLEVEENELTELDCDSCTEMLDLQGVIDKDLQVKIISVTGGNPFVIDAICDMMDEGTIVMDDIENLRADTLEEVRLKTWRRLFNMVGDLQDVINRAGLLEFFNRNLMDIIAPSMTTDMWDRLMRLSFVTERDDGTWVLHDLAQELILAELGHRVTSLAREVGDSLEQEATSTGNLALYGHAFSVRALSSEEEALADAKERITDLVRRDKILDALEILENTRFHSIKGKADLAGLRGSALAEVNRVSEAEDAIRDAIRVNEALEKNEPEKHLDSLGQHLTELHRVLRRTRFDEANEAISRALEIQRKAAESGGTKQLENLAWTLLNYAWSMGSTYEDAMDSVAPAKEAIRIYRKIGKEGQIPYSLNILAAKLGRAHRYADANEVYQEAIVAQRKLLESDPEHLRYKGTLVAILNGLAIMELDYGGDMKAAERYWNEALAIRRSLTESDPEVMLQRMDVILWNHGILYLRLYRLDEAEKPLLEIIEIAKEHVEESPEVFGYWEEGAHFILSLINSIRGRDSEAISSIEIAIASCRKRLAAGSSALALYLGQQLDASATINMRIGDYEKAENALLEAIQLYREYESLPPRHQGVFAGFLNNCGILLWRTGRMDEAKSALEEAIDIARSKVEEAPECYKVLLSNSLNNLALIQADSDELESAETLFLESLSIIEYLANRTPEVYTSHHALVLHNFAHLHSKAGHDRKATSLLERAIEIKRELAKRFPEVFEPSIELSLANLGVMEGNLKRQMVWEVKYITFEELP